MDIVAFFLRNEIVLGVLIKHNHYTVLVRLQSGDIVKRHIKKHNVQLMN